MKKITGFIYLPGSQFYQADSNLKLKSCLHGDVINTALCVGKSINKNGFFILCPPRRLDDKNMNKIEHSSCVSNFITNTFVSNIEIKKWGENIILKKYIMGCISAHAQ